MGRLECTLGCSSRQCQARLWKSSGHFATLYICSSAKNHWKFLNSGSQIQGSAKRVIFFLSSLQKQEENTRAQFQPASSGASQLLVACPYKFNVEQAPSLLESHRTLSQESSEYFLCPFPNRSFLQSLPALLLGRHTLLQKKARGGGVSKVQLVVSKEHKDNSKSTDVLSTQI